MQTEGFSKGDEGGELGGASKAVSKKKKKKDEINSHELVKQDGPDNKSSGSKNSEEVIANPGCQELNVKSKENKKKKKKNSSDPSGEGDEQERKKELKLAEPLLEEHDKYGKDKKKKKSKLVPEPLASTTEDHLVEALPSATEENNKDIAPSEGKNATDSGTETKIKDKGKKKNKLTGETDSGYTDATDSQKDDRAGKGSKKRKRLVSEENDPQPVDKKAVEETKRRKIDGLKEFKESELQGNVNASVGSHENANKENKEHGQILQENENIDNTAEKSMKKQHNGTAEVQIQMYSLDCYILLLYHKKA